MADGYWLAEAYRVALQSPDPSTQNGAVVVPSLLRPEGKTAEACNTFPRGVQNTPERLERPLKYSFIEHAERGAIYAAARAGIQTEGATLYCPWYACFDCARAIICAGIKRVVGHKAMMDATPDHWRESIDIAMTMLSEAGVETVLLSSIDGGYMRLDRSGVLPPIRFNSRLWSPDRGEYVD